MNPIPFIGGTYQHSAAGVGNARTVNWIPEMNRDGISKIMLMGAPGIRDLTEVGDGPVWGVRFLNNFIWVVSGREVYRIDREGNYELLGEVDETRRPVMSNNLTQVFFCNGANTYYIKMATSTLNRAIDGDSFPSSSCTFQDGFGIFVRDGSTQSFVSEIDDVSDFNGLDFEENLKEADLLLAVVSDGEYVWKFKERTIEIWFNNANPVGSPFSPQDGAYHTVGTSARWSCLRDRQGSIFFLGSDGRFYQSSGLQIIPISDEGIEDIIAGFGDVSEAYAFSYTLRGKVMYSITFPAQGRTFEYRPDTKMWNERESWENGSWRVSSLEEAWDGMVVVGDSLSGKVGILDRETYTEWGEPLEAYRICQHFQANQAPIFMDTMEMIFEGGAGNTNDPGKDPECILRMSDNDGRTWFGMMTAKIGKKGEFRRRAMFRRLGSYTRRTYRLSIKDPVRRDLIDVLGELDVGNY